jgi:hypothetical protein
MGAFSLVSQAGPVDAENVGVSRQVIDMGDNDSLEFFGVTIKCKSAHLAALLNSNVTEDVVVVGGRARDLLTADLRGADSGSRARSEDQERADILSMICEAD